MEDLESIRKPYTVTKLVYTLVLLLYQCINCVNLSVLLHTWSLSLFVNSATKAIDSGPIQVVTEYYK